VITHQFQIPVGTSEEKLITTITSEGLVDDSVPRMSIDIPTELALLFKNSLSNVRAASFLYHNVEDLFPSSLPGRENLTVK
jgi:hypothetical protein